MSDFNAEPDGLDETWVLYDRKLVDDELYAMWWRFRPGLRVVGRCWTEVPLRYPALLELVSTSA